MRVRNKELRQRRHRKEQRVKELIKVEKAEAKSGGKTKGVKAPSVKKAPAPKAAPVEASEAKPKRAPKKKPEAE